MIVVTGAAGHVGNALLRALAARRAREGADSPFAGLIRAIVRPGGRLPHTGDLDIELFEADLCDPAVVVEALRAPDGRGADYVFHLAGVVSITREKLEPLRRVNVEGTRNVVAACKELGVKRLVYASSIHAFAEEEDGMTTTESTPLDPEQGRSLYARTKAEATELVLAAARDGLDAVVVFPSGIIGPLDYGPSHIGEFILNCMRRKIFAYVEGGYNFVDVRDVADGLIAALEHGRPGEGYILAGHEITVPELIRLVEEFSGVPGPRLRLPFGFVRGVSFLIPIYYRATGKKPLFTTYSLDVIASNCCMSSAKAVSELGYSCRPLEDTMQDTVDWLREAHDLPVGARANGLADAAPARRD